MGHRPSRSSSNVPSSSADFITGEVSCKHTMVPGARHVGLCFALFDLIKHDSSSNRPVCVQLSAGSVCSIINQFMQSVPHLQAYLCDKDQTDDMHCRLTVISMSSCVTAKICPCHVTHGAKI